MCGRFVQTLDPDAYAEWFEAEVIKTEGLDTNYNVAPTDEVYAVAEHEGQRQLGTFRWGLIPWWAKDRKIAARHINARMETAATKPAFKESYTGRRCLIPADGFYEWERIPDKGKLPHYIYGADGHPLALAGLWASWKDPESGERARTCTILTGSPDDLVAPIHDRMPVILPQELWDDWLDPSLADPAEVAELLASRPGVGLAEHAVSTLVNSVRNNVPELVAPLRG
jgi:putative SOS response-associated peptidase YedK